MKTITDKSGNKLVVWFQHNRRTQEQEQITQKRRKEGKKRQKSVPRESTVCQVYRSADYANEGLNATPVGVGVSFRNDEDNFNKFTGRMISLNRALKDVGVSRTQRTEFIEDIKSQPAGS